MAKDKTVKPAETAPWTTEPETVTQDGKAPDQADTVRRKPPGAEADSGSAGGRAGGGQLQSGRVPEHGPARAGGF